MPEASHDVAWEKGCGAECDREIFMMRIRGDMKKYIVGLLLVNCSRVYGMI